MGNLGIVWGGNPADSQRMDDSLWIKFLLVVANIAVVAILAGLAWFVNWNGPSFAAGGLAGVFTFFIYVRLKLGRWI